MNYSKIYDDFIISRRELSPTVFETHHIIPKSFGGLNDSDNLINLSLSDHIFAHELLARIYGSKMWQALFLMGITRKTSNKKSRMLLEITKEKRNHYMSEKMMNRHVSNKTRKKRSDTFHNKTDEQKRVIGENISNAKKSQNFTHSEETKANISATKTGSKHSEETRKKMSDSMTGVKKTPQKELNVLIAVKLLTSLWVHDFILTTANVIV